MNQPFRYGSAETMTHFLTVQLSSHQLDSVTSMRCSVTTQRRNRYRQNHTGEWTEETGNKGMYIRLRVPGDDDCGQVMIQSNLANPICSRGRTRKKTRIRSAKNRNINSSSAPEGNEHGTNDQWRG